MYGAETKGVENDANTSWYKMLYTCILTLTFRSGAIWWSCEAIRACRAPKSSSSSFKLELVVCFFPICPRVAPMDCKTSTSAVETS